MRNEKIFRWKKALRPYYDEEYGLYEIHCPYCFSMFRFKLDFIQSDTRHTYYCGKNLKLEDLERGKKWKRWNL